jgi:DNA-binding transcriptional MerR regulator
MLRHYDQIGLLVPAHVDPRTRYRSYTADQLPRLRRIVALKELGFPLEQVAALVDEDISNAEVRRRLHGRRAELARTLHLDRARLLDVEDRLSAIDQAQQDREYEVVIRPVASQVMATLRDVVPSLGRPIEHLFDEVEAYAARHRARAAHSPLLIFHDGAVRNAALDVEVGIPVTRSTPDEGRISVREVPGTDTMACAVYSGGYERTSDALRALRAWASTNGWAIIGPPREVYIRFGADHADALELPRAFLTDEPDAYVTEVQLPLEPPEPLRSESPQ